MCKYFKYGNYELETQKIADKVLKDVNYLFKTQNDELIGRLEGVEHMLEKDDPSIADALILIYDIIEDLKEAN